MKISHHVEAFVYVAPFDMDCGSPAPFTLGKRYPAEYKGEESNSSGTYAVYDVVNDEGRPHGFDLGCIPEEGEGDFLTEDHFNVVWDIFNRVENWVDGVKFTYYIPVSIDAENYTDSSGVFDAWKATPMAQTIIRTGTDGTEDIIMGVYDIEL